MRRPMLLTLLCFFTLGGVGLAWLGQEDTASASKRRSFTLSAVPSLNIEKPVDLYSVGVIQEGLTVGRVQIRNISQRHVDTVILVWQVFRKNSPDTILASGETPSLAVTLRPAEARLLEYNVVSFRKVHKQLGYPIGDFRIRVSVKPTRRTVAARPSGGMSFGLAAAPAAPIKVTSSPVVVPVLYEGCQNKGCQYDESETCYNCAGEMDGFWCSTPFNQCPGSCDTTACNLEIQ